MTAQNIHLNKIKEHMQALKESIVAGIENRPASIGFHTSACAIDILELYLHKIGKIQIGAQIKHEWFKRPKAGQKVMPLAERKLRVDFQNKKEILEFMYTFEENRNKLIYGNSTKSEIKLMIDTFDKYKQLMAEMLSKQGVEIESSDN